MEKLEGFKEFTWTARQPREKISLAFVNSPE